MALNLHWSLAAAHTWHSVQSQRKVDVGRLHDFLDSRYRARTTQLFGEVSRPISLALLRPPRSIAEPFARLAWIRADFQGYTEQGGQTALRGLPVQQSVLFSTVGLRLRHAFETAVGQANVQAQLAWRYASSAVQSMARYTFRDGGSQTSFSSQGQPLARSAWSFTLGLTASLTENLRFGLTYAGQYASRQQDHGARLNLAWVF